MSIKKIKKNNIKEYKKNADNKITSLYLKIKLAFRVYTAASFIFCHAVFF